MSRGLNLHNPPLDDLRVRKAVAHRINVEQIMSNVFGDSSLYQLDGALFFPEQKLLYTTAGLEDYGKFDLSRAKQLLQEAGSPSQEIVILTQAEDPINRNVAVILGQQLAAAGLNARVEALDLATSLQHFAQPRDWHVWPTATTAGSLLPTALPWASGVFPYDGYYAKDDAIANLLAQWATRSTDNERKALMDQIQTQVYRDVPLVKFGDVSGLAGVSPKLHINMSFYQPTYWDMWLNG